MTNPPVHTRVQKHRKCKCRAKLRPVLIWAPDTRSPGFAEECRRQSRLVAESDAADTELWEFLDAALAEMQSG